MRYTLNDGAAMLDYLRHGRPGPFFQGMADWFRAKEALSARAEASGETAEAPAEAAPETEKEGEQE